MGIFPPFQYGRVECVLEMVMKKARLDPAWGFQPLDVLGCGEEGTAERGFWVAEQEQAELSNLGNLKA